jgi:hypothetical protein
MEILLLVVKAFLFVLEMAFELWKRQNRKALDAQIIQRLHSLENEVKKLKS